MPFRALRAVLAGMLTFQSAAPAFGGTALGRGPSSTGRASTVALPAVGLLSSDAAPLPALAVDTPLAAQPAPDLPVAAAPIAELASLRPLAPSAAGFAPARAPERAAEPMAAPPEAAAGLADAREPASLAALGGEAREAERPSALGGARRAAAYVAGQAADVLGVSGRLHEVFSGAALRAADEPIELAGSAGSPSPALASPGTGDVSDPPAEPASPEDALEGRLKALTQSLRAAEEDYYRGGEAKAEAALARARDDSGEALRLLAAAAAPRPPRGWRGWLESAGTWLLGELREKLDVRGTFAMIKRLLVTEGLYFAVYAAAIEIIEDVILPIILYLVGLPELIPVVLIGHSEPVTWPLYFIVRWWLWKRKLWGLAGGRARYKALKDFRHRLLDEDPARRVERLFLRGLPFAEGRAVAVNVNRSKLPAWVPLWIRNLVDRDFRTYDLYISINELATLAPKPLVRALRAYYKDHPRAVSYLLARAILEGGGQARARLVQNLAFKYWMNLGFGRLQPTLLRYFGDEERALEKANREFASHFFLLASEEERRLIETLVSDAFAAGALLRLEGADAGALLETMAPFLPESYPRTALSRGALAASETALMRAHMLLRRLLREGNLQDGRAVTVGGEPFAVIHGGRPIYLGKTARAMERALERRASAVAGAEEFLERYEREVGAGVLRPAGPPARPGMADDISPAEPQLLTRLYWVKQTLVPRRAEALIAAMDSDSEALPRGRARRRYRRDMREQIARLRELLKRLEILEFRWLNAYYDRRFLRDEARVPGYEGFRRELAELEDEAQAAAAAGAALTAAARGSRTSGF